MRAQVLVLALLFASCNDGDSNGNDNNGDGDADTDADGDADGDSDADGDVDNTPDASPDQTIAGDLADGAKIALDWADDSSVACWPGNENVNFTGNHVFFTIDKNGFDEIWVEADPANGVDVSLYTLEFSGSIQQPPDVSSATRCEAAFDQATDHNPGDPEEVYLMGFGDRLLLVGVAGADGETAGEFEIKVWKDHTAGFDTAR